MLLIIVVVVLVFGGFGGYRAWGPTGGGLSVGSLLLIVLVLWLLGVFR